MVCCCSLAGTTACKTCKNYSDYFDYFGRNETTIKYVEPVIRIPSRTLTPSDLAELEHRFGKEVRFVIEDMLSGEGKRWEDKSTVQEN